MTACRSRRLPTTSRRTCDAMIAFPHLAATLRDLAAQYWRDGDHVQASALHMRAIMLEAGCTEAELEKVAARNHRNGRAA